MSNVVSSTQIVPTGFTDHSLISMSFKLPFPPCGGAYWSLNTRLLQDKGFSDAFRDVWEKIRSSRSDFDSLRLWWGIAKTQIKPFCQQYSLYSTTRQSISIDRLKREIVFREQNNDEDGKDTCDQLIWSKKALLEEMVRQQAIGTLVRMRMSYLTLDMPNKEFFKLETSLKRSQLIHSLLTPNWVPGDL